MQLALPVILIELFFFELATLKINKAIRKKNKGFELSKPLSTKPFINYEKIFSFKTILFASVLSYNDFSETSVFL